MHPFSVAPLFWGYRNPQVIRINEMLNNVNTILFVHGILLAKLVGYGLVIHFHCYIYSYLLNQKQRVRIKNINSDFLNVVSSVPKGSIVGPILFSYYFNDFFYVIQTVNVHNFVDDNTLKPESHLPKKFVLFASMKTFLKLWKMLFI